MRRGWFVHAVSLINRLKKCCHLFIPKHKRPLWEASTWATSQHKKYCIRNGTKVVYDPKPDMSEEEVKHIKLKPVLERLEGKEFNTRKYALLLSFNGLECYGMQRNETGNTIEDRLMVAMLDAEFIDEYEYLVPQFFSFQRSSRTDKGVSAARLLVSCKLSNTNKWQIKKKLNQLLDDKIRVMAVFRTIKNFNSKIWCESRTYSYTCPTFAFASYTEVVHDGYRLSADGLEEVRELFRQYKGGHNFHNFTSHVKPDEHRAFRTILDIGCSDPFEANGVEWITIKIKGYSFMLHQIRKMIGLVIGIRRGLASVDFVCKVLSRDYAFFPTAPGLGLVLENQHFDRYNNKYGSKTNTAEKLCWDSKAEEIEEFYQKNILLPIMKTELAEKSMFKWLQVLHCCSFDILDGTQKKNEDCRLIPPLVKFARIAKYMSETGDSIAAFGRPPPYDEGEENIQTVLKHHEESSQSSQ